ncbi:OsmC family protein [Pararhizobium mangrovi]|uniref:OsmC family protein n=1 Tax=Pararhizobium mangrovi TaxID=2590452 RepID=A0A506U1D2_9HYPH|nr:OsmC family protein [Pararhizobium mangrovi]TPW27051.1 OsmC family protein [Pararhizobium mangrovi]
MKRQATAIWQGALADGKGTLDTQSGALKSAPYSFRARFEDESGTAGTNPEELLAAAHAGCFAMQLSHMLAENGTPAERLEAKAVVSVQEASGGGFEIPKSALELTANVPGISQDDFQKIVTEAKEGCPVSKALGAIEITLDSKLG